jgi:GT2 family glycosyltransferase
MRVTAILASHNRRTHTLMCLASYYAQDVDEWVELSAVLVDDDSTDGTREAILKHFPQTRVVRGDGSLFWAKAMSVAEEVAQRECPDHFLWLNDDVVLDRDALRRLLTTVEQGQGTCIAVGALRDPLSGDLTYSGVRRIGCHPLRVRLIAPGRSPIKAETFNGNTVLVPSRVREKIGSIDGEFAHSEADFDYGLRATSLGVPCYVAVGTLGTCERNHGRLQWREPALPVRQRVRVLLGSKGVPPRSRMRYLRRHGGPFWIVFWLVPYFRAIPSLIRPPWRAVGQQENEA